MTIKAVEDFLVATLKGRFGARLRGVETLPSEWDSKVVERMLVLAPAAFVVFAGGPSRGGTTDIVGRWIVVAVTAHKNNEPARRHGDAREIGAYEIIETVVPLLHDRTVPDVGTLQFVDVANLFNATDEARGLAIYGAGFDLPMALAPADPGAPDPLDAFITFHGTTDLAPADGQADAEDTVTLPQ